jgi:DNA-directed RNA polymerase specialized sigma24 family protein
LLDVKRSLDRLDEGELLRRIARGDRPAFDELYRRSAPWLTVRLRRRCVDPDVVAEVLQDTYLAVWRSAGSHANASANGSALGWMWTIAAHRLVDAFRRRARQERVPAVPTFETVAAAAEDEALAGGIGADLERALLALPPELRQVLAYTVYGCPRRPVAQSTPDR